MKSVKVILRVFAFLMAVTATFAFSPVKLADQIVSKGFVVASTCQEENVRETTCDLEETSGIACTLNISGFPTALKSGCEATLYKDDD